MDVNEEIARKPSDDDHGIDDPTAPFNETEIFHNIWEALRWKQIRNRVPICFKKTIRNRYMLANLVYLGYAIGILIIDFNPDVNGTSDTTANDSCTTTTVTLDQPVVSDELVNRLYLGKFQLKSFVQNKILFADS